MQVGGFSSSAAALLSSLGKTAETGAIEAFRAPTELEGARQKEQAKSAASNASFPTIAPVAMDAATLLALQGDDAGKTGQAENAALDGADKDSDSGAVKDFLDYMKKTPEERLRDKILKAMGLTEEDLQNMSPDERLGIENKIRDIIKETIVNAEGQGGAEREKAKTAISMQQMMLDAM
ncbi:MAG TPA: hypothetical protein PK050_13220 [Hyphomonadaceae bacterium]|nr:hypothetical protein [Hyphomonadaceae bacterium]